MLFKTQALRVLDRPIHEVTTFYSLRLIDSVIKADVDFIDYDEDFFSNWIESMSLSDVAEIIMKHFGKKMDMGKTLNQAFIEISFCYSLDDDYYELESSQKWTIYFMITVPWETKLLQNNVLVKQEHLPTRLHTKWRGPFRVISFVGSEFVLANLITHKQYSVHLK